MPHPGRDSYFGLRRVKLLQQFPPDSIIPARPHRDHGAVGAQRPESRRKLQLGPRARPSPGGGPSEFRRPGRQATPNCLPENRNWESLFPSTSGPRALESRRRIPTLQKVRLRPREGRDGPLALPCTAQHLPPQQEGKPSGSMRKRLGLPTIPSHSGRAGPHSVRSANI